MNNWYTELKQNIVLLSKISLNLEIMINNLLNNNMWILTDINLCESYEKFKEISKINNEELTNIVDYINYLDESCICFSHEDLNDEFSIISDNFDLQLSFLLNMMRYIINTKEFNDQDNQVEALESYFNYDIFCFNQIKINNNLIKEIRKERR